MWSGITKLLNTHVKQVGALCKFIQTLWSHFYEKLFKPWDTHCCSAWENYFSYFNWNGNVQWVTPYMRLFMGKERILFSCGFTCCLLTIFNVVKNYINITHYFSVWLFKITVVTPHHLNTINVQDLYFVTRLKLMSHSFASRKSY